MSLPLAVADDRQPLRVAARACAFATAIVVFVVSAMALQAVGVPYEAEGGGALQKLRPATYLAVLALILEAASRPRPLDYLAALPLRFPGATYSPSILRWLSPTRRCSRSRRSRR